MCWKYVVTFPEEGAPQTLLPSVTLVPRSMPCFRCIQRFNPFQFLPNFYYFYICLSLLKMYRVILTAQTVRIASASVGIASFGTESVGIASASPAMHVSVKDPGMQNVIEDLQSYFISIHQVSVP